LNKDQGQRRNRPGTGARIVWVVLSIVLAVIALAAAPTKHMLAAGNYVVNSNGDQADQTPGDNICKIAGSNNCTLRAAIQEANAHTGADTITFNIGSATISPNTNLPEITDGSTIIRGDGNITLNGGNVANALYGLQLHSNYNRVQGLRIQNFERGIYIRLSHHNIVGVDGDGMTDTNTERNVIGDNLVGILMENASQNWIAGNFIGVNPGGNGANPNVFGISILRGRSNLIGTNADGVSDAAERNVISGNTNGSNGYGISVVTSDRVTIAGNYIGTNAAGDSALPNMYGIILNDSDYGVIGVGGSSPSSSQRNVISGNTIGLLIQHSTHNTAAGNYIGTRANGNQALGNTNAGVVIHYADFNLIGTDADEENDDLERNVISGNNHGISVQFGSLNMIAGNYVGTRADGSQALGNTGDGVQLKKGSNGNQVGINAGGNGHINERNVISGNGGNGVVIIENSYNTVGGNYIGVDASGKDPMGNAKHGVLIEQASNNAIGWPTPQFTFPADNVIAYNGENGIAVIEDKALHNQFMGNAIFENDALGIDLGDDGVTANDSGDADNGPNDLVNFPIGVEAISDGSMIGIEGKIVDGIASADTVIIEFFASEACDASGNGEGEVFLGRVYYDLSVTGTNFDFNEVFSKSVDPGMAVTMTATWMETFDNNTSEFSECIEVKEGKPERKR
jgi:CSLREA domain-containing protein